MNELGINVDVKVNKYLYFYSSSYVLYIIYVYQLLAKT